MCCSEQNRGGGRLQTFPGPSFGAHVWACGMSIDVIQGDRPFCPAQPLRRIELRIPLVTSIGLGDRFHEF